MVSSPSSGPSGVNEKVLGPSEIGEATVSDLEARLKYVTTAVSSDHDDPGNLAKKVAGTPWDSVNGTWELENMADMASCMLARQSLFKTRSGGYSSEPPEGPSEREAGYQWTIVFELQSTGANFAEVPFGVKRVVLTLTNSPTMTEKKVGWNVDAVLYGNGEWVSEQIEHEEGMDDGKEHHALFWRGDRMRCKWDGHENLVSEPERVSPTVTSLLKYITDALLVVENSDKNKAVVTAEQLRGLSRVEVLQILAALDKSGLKKKSKLD